MVRQLNSWEDRAEITGVEHSAQAKLACRWCGGVLPPPTKTSCGARVSVEARIASQPENPAG